MPEPLLDADPALVADLVTANRILANEGVVDGFGHVSARHDKRPDHFLLARSMAPALVGVADIMAFDIEGNAAAGDARTAYLERFIHGEIYRARPDVAAVVHSHSPSVIPFGVVSGAALRPLYHMSGFLGPAAPVFEIRTVAPASDMLIRDRRLGAALAEALGPAAFVLMRGHGATAVGATLRQAVYRAVYAEVNARLQAMAMQLGPVTYLSDEEAERATHTNNGQLHRAWEVWRQALAAPGLG
jgi:HCOMODA/2-hydroxy-3-carboxy-muconic semialdehyde decarboxylase